MSDEQRRLLELLAANDADGCTDALLAAHGFAVEVIDTLARTGLATVRPEPILDVGWREIEISRVRITAAGRRGLEEPELGLF